MVKRHRVFTLEFKREAVYLAHRRGKSIRQTAHDLDIAPSTFYRWYKQFSPQREDLSSGHKDKDADTIEEEYDNMLYSNEIRTLLTQIEAEYQAGQLGLSGLAEGTSRHEVIEHRMTRMGELHSQLHSLVGDEAAKLVARALDALPEHPDSNT